MDLCDSRDRQHLGDEECLILPVQLKQKFSRNQPSAIGGEIGLIVKEVETWWKKEASSGYNRLDGLRVGSQGKKQIQWGNQEKDVSVYCDALSV